MHEPHTPHHVIPKYQWRFPELEEDDNIYALGDAVELESNRANITDAMPLAGATYKQGRVVADNL